jgi:hypothetical protein
MVGLSKIHLLEYMDVVEQENLLGQNNSSQANNGESYLSILSILPSLISQARSNLGYF